jgi:hypothetical protein
MVGNRQFNRLQEAEEADLFQTVFKKKENWLQDQAQPGLVSPFPRGARSICLVPNLLEECAPRIDRFPYTSRFVGRMVRSSVVLGRNTVRSPAKGKNAQS